MDDSDDQIRDDRLSVGIKEAARLLGISKRMVEYRIAERELASCRDGRRTLINMAELRRYRRKNHYKGRPKKKELPDENQQEQK